MTLNSKRKYVTILVTFLVCLWSWRPAVAEQWASPQHYLEAKQPGLAERQACLAVVHVSGVTDGWIVADGDWISYQVVTVVADQKLAGADVPTQVGVLHGMVCPGQTYLMYAVREAAEPTPDDIPTRWVSVDFSNLFKQGDDQFVQWAPYQDPADALIEKPEPALPYRLMDLQSWLHDHAGPLKLADLSSPKLRIEHVQQLLEQHRDFDAKDVVGALESVVLGTNEEAAYQGASLLGDVASARPAARADVVLALNRSMPKVSRRMQVALACALAELGIADGHKVLLSAFEHQGPALAMTGDGHLTPGYFRYDMDKAELTSAYYLGLLGDPRGLKDPDERVQLAAASGLVPRHAPEAQPTLHAIMLRGQLMVEKLRQQGKLGARRRPGDVADRYPATWIKACALLASTGSQDALQRLVDAWLQDASTYPKGDPLTDAVTPIVVQSTWHSVEWPSLAQAIASSAPDHPRLLARLERIYGSQAVWKSAPMLALRRSLRASPKQAKKTPVDAAAVHHDEVVRLVSSADKKNVERGLVAAGNFRYPDLYDRVMSVAQTDAGITGDAAVYALNLYHRPIEPEVGRQLLGIGELDHQLQALELVTQPGARPFKSEIWHVVQQAAEQSGLQSSEYAPRSRTATRVLSRLFRYDLPDAAQVRQYPRVMQLWIVQALYWSGNLQSVPLLQELVKGPDRTVAMAADDVLPSLDPQAEIPLLPAETPPAGVLSMHGVAIGMAEADVRTKWAATTAGADAGTLEFTPSDSGTVTCEFHEGKVAKLTGDEIELDGKVVLTKHATIHDVTTQFGEPDDSDYDESKPTLGWVRYHARHLFISVSPHDGVSFMSIEK